ncbi:General transcription factor IIF subunit 2, partial [Kappamyces sp. JEL0680]
MDLSDDDERDEDMMVDHVKAEEDQGEKEDEVEDLDVAAAETKTWLVKIPSFIAEKWKEIPEAGVELGKMRIYKNNRPGKKTPMIKMVLPEIATEIRRIMKLRTKLAMEKSSSRHVERMDSKAARDKGLLATAGNRWDTHKHIKKKTMADKREKLEKSDLRALIFAQFQTATHLTFRALSDRTMQPESYLREVLQEICDINKRGPNLGKYELKAEFKDSNLMFPQQMEFKYEDKYRSSFVGDPQKLMGPVALPLFTLDRKPSRDVHDYESIDMGKVSPMKDVNSDTFLDTMHSIQSELASLRENEKSSDSVALPRVKLQLDGLAPAAPANMPAYSFLKVKSQDDAGLESGDRKHERSSTDSPSRKRTKILETASSVESLLDTPDHCASSVDHSAHNGTPEDGAKPPADGGKTTRVRIERDKFQTKAAESQMDDNPTPADYTKHQEHSQDARSQAAETHNSQDSYSLKKDSYSLKKSSPIGSLPSFRPGSFSIGVSNGKEVLPNQWGEIAAALKHKAEGKERGKEKAKDKDKVYSFQSTIYFAAAIMAYHTWFHVKKEMLAKYYDYAKSLQELIAKSLKEHKGLATVSALILSVLVPLQQKELGANLQVIASYLKDPTPSEVGSISEKIAKMIKSNAVIIGRTKELGEGIKAASTIISPGL